LKRRIHNTTNYGSGRRHLSYVLSFNDKQRSNYTRTLKMALSKQVEESLVEAQEDLRNALSFSARTEKPYISKHIADMMSQIDNIISIVPILDTLDEVRERDVLE
tara:strand:- start:5749 stop:6063 length:315 start_codon:yes stop_codon:yes gene_type:complete